METFGIRLGGPYLDADGLHPLAEDAHREGIRIICTLTERWKDGTERFDRAGERMLVAVAGPAVVGVGALSHCPNVEFARRMRRFYVSPGWRRRGVARALAGELVEFGFAHADLITCNAAASDAAGPFWESMGFEPSDTGGITHSLRRR